MEVGNKAYASGYTLTNCLLKGKGIHFDKQRNFFILLRC